jgi:hypothetical protein
VALVAGQMPVVPQIERKLAAVAVAETGLCHRHRVLSVMIGLKDCYRYFERCMSISGSNCSIAIGRIRDSSERVGWLSVGKTDTTCRVPTKIHGMLFVNPYCRTFGL